MVVWLLTVNGGRWQAIDYARLSHSTISFFNCPETAASRWSRVSLIASKVLFVFCFCFCFF